MTRRFALNLLQHSKSLLKLQVCLLLHLAALTTFVVVNNGLTASRASPFIHFCNSSVFSACVKPHASVIVLKHTNKENTTSGVVIELWKISARSLSRHVFIWHATTFVFIDNTFVENIKLFSIIRLFRVIIVKCKWIRLPTLYLGLRGFTYSHLSVFAIPAHFNQFLIPNSFDRSRSKIIDCSDIDEPMTLGLLARDRRSQSTSSYNLAFSKSTLNLMRSFSRLAYWRITSRCRSASFFPIRAIPSAFPKSISSCLTTVLELNVVAETLSGTIVSPLCHT